MYIFTASKDGKTFIQKEGTHKELYRLYDQLRYKVGIEVQLKPKV